MPRGCSRSCRSERKRRSRCYVELLVQLGSERLVVEHVFGTGLAIVEIAANAPDDDIAAALGCHLLELDVAYASVGIHNADRDAVDVAEALEGRLARVTGCRDEDHVRVVELAALAQLCSAYAEEARQAL